MTAFRQEDVPTHDEPAWATTGRSVVRGGAWKVLSSVLPQLYTLVISVAAGRYLGAAALGRQSFIAFVELSTVQLLATGTAVALMRTVGELTGAGRAGAVRRLVRTIVGIELVAACVAGGGLAVVGLTGHAPRGAWILAGLTAFSAVLVSVPGAILTGLQQWRLATVAGLTTGGLATAATVVALALGGRITSMFAIEAAAAAVSLAWTSSLARGSLGRLPPSDVAFDAGPRFYRFAAVVTAGQILNLVVWRRSEFFFLEHDSTSAELAFYSISFALVAAVVRLPAAMGQVISPAVATLLGAGQSRRIQTGFGRALRLLLLATLPLTATAAALGPAVLELLWGHDYAGAGTPLRIMVGASLVTPLGVLSAALLSGLGRAWMQLGANALAAVADVGTAAVLVPGHGATGAAIANLVGQATAGGVLIAYAVRVVGPVDVSVRALASSACISAAGGAGAFAVVAWSSSAAGVVVALLLDACIVIALACLLRPLPDEDARWLLGATAAGDRKALRRIVLAISQT